MDPQVYLVVLNNKNNKKFKVNNYKISIINNCVMFQLDLKIGVGEIICTNFLQTDRQDEFIKVL